MKKIVTISESRLTDIIEKLISEQISLSETKKDVYKPVWDRNDTIITLYCALYGIKKLGYKEDTEGYDDLANEVIGSTSTSLKRQMGNMKYLMGLDDSQSDVSKLQKSVYDEYHNMPEEKLRQICDEIIETNIKDGSNYLRYKEQYEKFQGKKLERQKETVLRKKKESWKKQSEDHKNLELKRKGVKDVSKMKSIGTRPIDKDNRLFETKINNYISNTIKQLINNEQY